MSQPYPMNPSGAAIRPFTLADALEAARKDVSRAAEILHRLHILSVTLRGAGAAGNNPTAPSVQQGGGGLDSLRLASGEREGLLTEIEREVEARPERSLR